MIISDKLSKPVRPMSEEEIELAARTDPDARPLTDHELHHMKRTPRVKIIRRALDLSIEQFAERYAIPADLLRAWEQGKAEPDQTAYAYLRAIAGDPDGVRRALRSPAATDA